MTAFEDKERAYESKYAFDKEQEFKINARRNKLFGLWAAAQLHYDAEKASAYAKEVVMSDFDEPGDEDVFRKVNEDFKKAGLKISEQEIRTKMHQLIKEARDQLAAEA
jgi:hypothetical protein